MRNLENEYVRLEGRLREKKARKPGGHKVARALGEAWQRTAMTEAHRLAREIDANDEETLNLVVHSLTALWTIDRAGD